MTGSRQTGRRVVVTGIGIISNLGDSPAMMGAALRAGMVS